MNLLQSIIKGSNEPLIIEVEFDDDIESEVKKLSGQLINNGQVIKEWTLEDVSFANNDIILPLTESDTLKLTDGYATLDLKFLNQNDIVVFFDVIKYRAIDRANTSRLTEV